MLKDQGLPDNVLIQLIESGDRIGFEALYDQYSPVLFLVITRYVTKREAAENLLEQSFLEILCSLPNIDHAEALLPQLIKITRRLAIAMI